MRLPFNEQFLQFIWQHQCFDTLRAKTKNGEIIQVQKPGFKNADEGPDFKNALIKIGDVLWTGSVEAHLQVKDWSIHMHQSNPNYNSVILHVVYENKSENETRREDGTLIPVLELKELITTELIEKGETLFENIQQIPCSSFFKSVDSLVKQSALDRALTHRLESKSKLVLQMLSSNLNDWEETTYQVVAQHFGLKVNNETFLKLATSMPLKLIVKSADSLLKIEALLFGQAGFLAHEMDDDYHRLLKTEYQYLRHKFGIENVVQIHEWQHLRLRPQNFPEIRIAQLAAFLHKSRQLHSLILNSKGIESLKNIFKIDTSGYWQTHYGFGKKGNFSSKHNGSLAIDNLLINVVANLFVAYSIYKSEEEYMENAIQLLEAINPENNKITRLWRNLDFEPRNAFDSQAMIELFNNNCSKKACLSCPIGVKILSR